MDLSKKQLECVLKDPKVILISAQIYQKNHVGQHAYRNVLGKHVKAHCCRDYAQLLLTQAPKIAEDTWNDLIASIDPNIIGCDLKALHGEVLMPATVTDVENCIRDYIVCNKQQHVALFHTNYKGRPADEFYKTVWRPKVVTATENTGRNNNYLWQKAKELFSTRNVPELNAEDFRVLNWYLRIEIKGTGIEIMPRASIGAIHDNLKQGLAAYEQRQKRLREKHPSENTPLKVRRIEFQQDATEFQHSPVNEASFSRAALRPPQAYSDSETEMVDTDLAPVEEVLAHSDDESSSSPELLLLRLKELEDFYREVEKGLVMIDNKDELNLLESLRFKSTKTKASGSWVSLEDYVTHMKLGQREIYFAEGKDKASVEKYQYLEPFLAKDVEVLYFTDVLGTKPALTAGSFKGIPFKNILTEVVRLEVEDYTDLVTRRAEYYRNKFTPLTKWLGKFYGTATVRITLSNRLNTEPATAFIAEDGDDLSKSEGARFHLELNPRHPFTLKLLERSPRDKGFAAADVEDAAWMLHDMALLNGGLPLSDPKAHTKRVMKLFMQPQAWFESMSLAPEPDLSAMEEG